MTRHSALALMSLLWLAAPAAAADWTLEHEELAPVSRLKLWSRSVAGSSYPEYRMEILLRAAPDEVAGALESNLHDPRTWPKGFERKVLHREPGAMLSYDYIAVPLLADRDVVIRTVLRRDPGSEALHIEWRAQPDAGPPPPSGVVRMPRSEGSWLVEPDGRGGTRAIYHSFVDFAGRIPHALVHSSVQAGILKQATWLRRALRERRLTRSR